MAIANCGGLKIDGTTLYEEDGVLKAQSGSSGGMVVNFICNEEGTEIISASKTVAEVKAALSTNVNVAVGIISAGSVSIVMLGQLGYELTGVTPTVYFVKPIFSNNAMAYLVMLYESNNTWVLTT